MSVHWYDLPFEKLRAGEYRCTDIGNRTWIVTKSGIGAGWFGYCEQHNDWCGHMPTLSEWRLAMAGEGKKQLSELGNPPI